MPEQHSMQCSTGQAEPIAALCISGGSQHDAGLHQQYIVQPIMAGTVHVPRGRGARGCGRGVSLLTIAGCQRCVAVDIRLYCSAELMTKALYEVLLQSFFECWPVSSRIELFPNCKKLWYRVVYDLPSKKHCVASVGTVCLSRRHRCFLYKLCLTALTVLLLFLTVRTAKQQSI